MTRTRHPMAASLSSDKLRYHACTDRIQSLIERWDRFAELHPLVEQEVLITNLLQEITSGLDKDEAYDKMMTGLRRKLKTGQLTNAEGGYNDGIKCAMSMLKAVYNG